MHLPEILHSQLAAALRTLTRCIDLCPDDLWTFPVGTYPFTQVAFHTLFFADYYLGDNPDSSRTHPFHAEHAADFADYEQLIDREPSQLHGREFLRSYATHCSARAADVFAGETDATLAAPDGFGRGFSRAELHIYNTRHVQHHAAQLSLRLRVERGIDIPWVRSGSA